MSKNDYKTVFFLLKHTDVSPNYRYRGIGALSIAIENDNKKMVELLLKNGVRPLLEGTRSSDNSLIVATIYNKYDIVEILINFGMNINRVDDDNSTPLRYACKNNNIRIVKLLLRNGADPNIAAQNGSTPLSEAIVFKNKELIDLLLQHGAKTSGERGSE